MSKTPDKDQRKALSYTELRRKINYAAARGLIGLDLSDNDITTLPSVIGKVSNLANLMLQGNLLVTLPREIGQLTNLRVLVLLC